MPHKGLLSIERQTWSLFLYLSITICFKKSGFSWENLEENLVPYTDALLAPSDGPLAYPCCASLLDGQKKWLSRQPLPIFARYMHPSLMQGVKVVSEGARQAFFDTFMVAGVVGHYRFVEF